VKSAIQTRFGAQAVKSRLSRSPARAPSLPGTVVLGVLPRLIPNMASSPINRSTVQCATDRPCRRSSTVILGRPYSDSGIASPLALVRAMISASTMTTSDTVRATSTRVGVSQAR